MAMKEIVVLHTWDLYVSKQRVYPKISWLCQSKSFFDIKKNAGISFTYSGGFSMDSTVHRALTSQVLTVAL